MAEWQRETFRDYTAKGFAARLGYGANPVLLVVDFINGFTDPSTPLGGDLSRQIDVTGDLLRAFRRGALPVVYTTIAYETDLRDAGMWIRKIPSLNILLKGSPMVEVDARISPRPGEYLVEKKFASAFFGTDLEAYLKGLGVDTIIMVGCTTSGCIRSSAVDAMQCGFHTIVVRDAVGDRADGPHEANLFDIDAKYGDVVSSHEVLEYVRSMAGVDGFAARAQDEFGRWWNENSSTTG